MVFLKQQFEATWKNPMLMICVIFTFLLMSSFSNPVIWKCAEGCQNLRTGKERIYSKKTEYKTRNFHTSDLHLEKISFKTRFFFLKI